MTQIEIDDANERAKKFNAELIQLLGKYKIGLAATPFITDGRIMARPTIFDDSKAGKVEEPDTKNEIKKP